MSVEELWIRAGEVLTSDVIRTALKVALILTIGFGAAWLAKRRLTLRNLRPQHVMLLRRAVSYTAVVLTLVWALREIGIDLSVLLGAAGILTVAIGFAAQTSASNLISGLFLMGEQPFEVGDVITVDGTTGEVLTIDLLSVRLRTFDNLQVRIPNETMLKANVTTLTRFPIRRADLQVGVAYREDLDRVKAVLEEVADRNPLCMTEPEPLFIFKGYGDSSLDMQFSVWGAKENFLALRNSMYLEIKAAFDREGIEIPFPHRSLYAGSRTDPLPVQLVQAPPPPDED